MPEYICPHCKQPINDDEALLCLYCGQSLNREVGFMGRLKYPKPKIILVVIIVLILAGFALTDAFDISIELDERVVKTVDLSARVDELHARRREEAAKAAKMTKAEKEAKAALAAEVAKASGVTVEPREEPKPVRHQIWNKESLKKIDDPALSITDGGCILG